MKSSEKSFGLASSSLFMVLVFIITETQASCTSSCGVIENISYPFRLKGDPDECGDNDYELACHNNQTFIDFNSANYLVTKISHDHHTVTIVDPSLVSGSCSFPHNTITKESEDSRYSVFHYYQKYTNVQFLRCSSEITNSTYIPIPCLNRDESSYAYFRYVRVHSLQGLFDLPKSCLFISAVPTDVYSVDYKMLQKSLLLGFNLSWSVHCKDCRLAGGSCQMENQEYKCSKKSKLSYLIFLLLIPITIYLILQTYV